MANKNILIQGTAKLIRRFANSKWLNTHVFGNRIGSNVKLRGLCKISDSEIGDYTYFGGGCTVKNTSIGKFCSIGPNFLCGWGIHPTNGISTAPAFYSTARQNGMTFCSENKVAESIPITIGNDVFIGANVIVLDGAVIGNGAVIGAGAVVSGEIPPYAIAAGVPARVIKYRFGEQEIEALEKIAWWDFDTAHLQDVERYFFDVSAFIEKYSEK